jgi:hypothetical protein
VPPPDEIYHEEIGVFWGRLAAAIMWLTCVTLFILLGVQRSYGPLGDNPAPDLVLVLMGVYFAAMGWVLLNFSTFTVGVTPGGLTAGYGRFRYYVAWENVAGYAVAPRSLTAYPGYGIHITRYMGKSALLYRVMGAPTLVLGLKKGRFGYLAFSTKRTDELMSLIGSYTRR